MAKELICPTCGADGDILKDLDPQPEGPVPGPVIECTACGEQGSEDHFTPAGEQTQLDTAQEAEPDKLELSEGTKKVYIDLKGTACPHCGGMDLEYVAEYIHEEIDELERVVKCEACQQSWTEVYLYILKEIR